MVKYEPITLDMKVPYEQILAIAGPRGCEYSFANLFLWGRQKIAFLDGCVTIFSQFNRRSVYLFPIGAGDKKSVLDAIIHDAAMRGIPCRLTGMTAEDCQLLYSLYPHDFRIHNARDSYDYLYDVNDLATLKGRQFQRKRNHLNRFLKTYPHISTEVITPENMVKVRQMVDAWYTQRLQDDPTQDFHMERAAMDKACRFSTELGLEGISLRVDGQIAAVTMGSRLSDTVFDVHFEKGLEQYDGIYAAINQEFAQYIQTNHPEITQINREDDMGLEGLRKAKLSYHPTRIFEKYWACLLEDGYDY